MSRKRILIVTASPLCRNPRVLKEADTLGSAGFDVTVLTIAGRANDEAIDQEILRDAPFKKIALPYFGFHGALGLGAHASRTFTSLARRLVPLGIERRSALGAFHRLHRVARRIPADLIIAHTELGLAVGYELLKRGRKVAVDIEDWHSQDLLPAAQTHRPLRLLQKNERFFLHNAVYVTTTSQAMAAALQTAFGGKRPFAITNSFPLQSDSASPKTNSHIPSFFWFSQTIGQGRGLESFLQAWSQTTAPSRLCLLGEIGADYKHVLSELIPQEKQSHVSFLPPISPQLLPSAIAKHDIGLALESKSPPSRNLTITNKILQYLNAGLAIIASSTAGHREVLQDNPQAGVFVDPANTTQFVSILENLLVNSKNLVAMQMAARELAEQKYNWEKEAPALLTLVESALAT